MESALTPKTYNNPTTGQLNTIIIIKIKNRRCNPNHSVDSNIVSNETVGNFNIIHSPIKVDNKKSKVDKVSSSNSHVSNIKLKRTSNNIRLTKTNIINRRNNIEVNNGNTSSEKHKDNDVNKLNDHNILDRTKLNNSSINKSKIVRSTSNAYNITNIYTSNEKEDSQIKDLTDVY